MPPRLPAALAFSLAFGALGACAGSKRSINGPTHEHEHCHDLPGGDKQCHTHPHDDAHKHDDPTAPGGSASTTPSRTAHEHEHCHERAAGPECHTHPHGDDHHEAPSASASARPAPAGPASARPAPAGPASARPAPTASAR